MNPGCYRKAIAEFWGILAVPAVVGVLALAGVRIGPETAALVIALDSTLGTGAVVRTKPNEPASAPAADQHLAKDISRTPPDQE